jgi:hypothetical protein
MLDNESRVTSGVVTSLEVYCGIFYVDSPIRSFVITDHIYRIALNAPGALQRSRNLTISSF